MKLLTPSRFVAVAALALAALGFGLAYGSPGSSAAPTAAGKKACVHGTALLERNKANVVAYYTRAFNDKEPEDAVERYVGFDKPGQDLDESGEPHLYIQHNPLAQSGAPAFIAFVRELYDGVPRRAYRHPARRRRMRPRRDARAGHGRSARLYGPRQQGGGHLPARRAREDRRALGRPRADHSVGRQPKRQPGGLSAGRASGARPRSLTPSGGVVA